MQTTLLAAVAICSILASCSGLEVDSRRKTEEKTKVVVPGISLGNDTSDSTNVQDSNLESSDEVIDDTQAADDPLSIETPEDSVIEPIEQPGEEISTNPKQAVAAPIFSDLNFGDQVYSVTQNNGQVEYLSEVAFANEEFESCQQAELDKLDRDINYHAVQLKFANYVLEKYGADLTNQDKDSEACNQMSFPTQSSIFANFGGPEAEGYFTLEERYYIALKHDRRFVDSLFTFHSDDDERYLRDEYLPEHYGSVTQADCLTKITNVRNEHGKHQGRVVELNTARVGFEKAIPATCKAKVISTINYTARLPEVFKVFKSEVINTVFEREFEQESDQSANCSESAVTRWFLNWYGEAHTNSNEAERESLFESGFILLGSVIDYGGKQRNGLQIQRYDGVIRQVFPEEGGIEKAWKLALALIDSKDRLSETLVASENTSDLYAKGLAPWVFAFDCSDDAEKVKLVRHTTNRSANVQMINVE